MVTARTNRATRPRKGGKEAFARFFEDPSRETFRTLILEQFGETRNLDFKAAWPDHAALAKHILGMANADGGVLVVGVEEGDGGALDAVGLPQLTDKADILPGIRKYLPSELIDYINVLDFSFEASEYPKLVNKSFQTVLVESVPEHVPFICASDGKGIRRAAIYVRREGSTEEASHTELQKIINVRIETKYSSAREMTVKAHIDQLRMLYSEIPEYTIHSRFDALGLAPFSAWTSRVRNDDYPRESLHAFLLRMIDAKKALIADELGVRWAPNPPQRSRGRVLKEDQ